jgi:hypothetical protein
MKFKGLMLSVKEEMYVATMTFPAWKQALNLETYFFSSLEVFKDTSRPRQQLGYVISGTVSPLKFHILRC